MAHQVDLRSDTVTKPTAAMRRAMAEADVGDDVYGEDPTVNRLQAMLSEMTGFEAGLFMPSGSMSNLVALAAHAPSGSEAIMPEGAHVYEGELGALSAVAGLIPRLVPAPQGAPSAADVGRALRDSIHHAPSGVVVLENTHNKAGGTVVDLERCRQIVSVAQSRGLPTHLDGARAFNAAVALDVSIADVCAGFDSVSICLSKGLGAPVGTVLLGSEAFIEAAHRHRKRLGGGMRQAGVVAAAGIVALRDMPERLAEDHRRARFLAEELASLAGVSVDVGAVHTNMIYVDVADAALVAARTAQSGVLVGIEGPNTIRLVTHHQITDDGVQLALRALREAVDSAIAAPGAKAGS